jgi:hypothetical protein
MPNEPIFIPGVSDPDDFIENNDTPAPIPPPTTPGQRRRGAPLGNKNAIKHGFYSSAYKTAEKNAVTSQPTFDLEQELALLRIFTRRLVVSVPSDASNQTILENTRVLALSLNTISRIMRAQWTIYSPFRQRHDIARDARQEFQADLERQRQEA